jgi:hypothetical protein
MNWIIYFLVFNAGGLFGFFVAAMMAAGGRADERADIVVEASSDEARQIHS